MILYNFPLHFPSGGSRKNMGIGGEMKQKFPLVAMVRGVKFII